MQVSVARRDLWGARRWRGATITATALAGLALLAQLALASTTVYWGYNNLTATNPPAGTCPGSTAGIACSGFQNWDYSEADWTAGDGAWVLGSSASRTASCTAGC
jgi:hypothetical protein